MRRANKLKITQREMKSGMLNISLRDKIRNGEIKRKTKVKDVEKIAAKKWGGQVMLPDGIVADGR